MRFSAHRPTLTLSVVWNLKSVLDTSGNMRKIDPIDQKTIDPKLLNNGLSNEIRGRGSLAWPGRQTHNLENKRG
jgi:hypothetical protein